MPSLHNGPRTAGNKSALSYRAGIAVSGYRCICRCNARHRRLHCRLPVAVPARAGVSHAQAGQPELTPRVAPARCAQRILPVARVYPHPHQVRRVDGGAARHG